MFKVQKPEYVNKTFRIPLDILSKLETLAQSEGVSLNNLVIQCCEYALEHLDTNLQKNNKT